MGAESTTIEYWDSAAAEFDDEPDHGLRDPAVRAAWAERLAAWLPEEPSDVLDVGCGTGSLALLACEQGHRVTAVDHSPAMAERARAKLAGATARVMVGDAAEPPVGEREFDVILVRHVLWALPSPGAVLRHWASLLRPGGRLVLVEGVWGEVSPVGIPAATLAAEAESFAARLHTERLSADARLWGRRVTDERYAMVVHPAPPRRHAEIVDVHLVLRRGDDVLLGRRAGTGYADGLLHAPSGHLEEGEDVVEAMVREAREEIGLDLDAADLRVALVMQHSAPGEQPRMGWFFEAGAGAGGEPVNAEPDKCSEIGWFPLADLPDDMVAYCRAGLEAYRAGHRFVLHRHRPDDGIASVPGAPSRAVPLPATGSTGPSSPPGR